MAVCNLYICFCNTAWFVEREIEYDDDGEMILNYDTNYDGITKEEEEKIDEKNCEETKCDESESTKDEGKSKEDDDSLWKTIVEKKMAFLNLFQRK